MTEIAETPIRKRQRSASDEETDNLSGNAFDPAGSTLPMTAETFFIPTVHRTDIDGFRSSSRKTRKQDKESSAATASDAIVKAFEKYQAIYLPKYLCGSSNDENKSGNGNETFAALQWNDLSEIFQNLADSDKESFCIENETASDGFAKTENEIDSGSDFLLEAKSKDDNRVGYCSFMVQNDKEALSNLIQKLPVKDPVTEADERDTDGASCWGYEPCLWIFFGRNHSKQNLDGRPEHTDQISHDGTWHFQLSGTKRWLLRPTPQLLRRWKPTKEEEKEANSNGSLNTSTANDESETEPNQMTIECKKGDVLIVNTRLWRHQTILPPQTEPSVSYARDFWIDPDQMKPNEKENDSEKAGTMTNVDGLYAMDDIAEDTIIFREDDMPDCELHRSSEENANCKVVQLEDGIHAVVSCKFIKAGEFFCIPEEDSDDDEEEVEGVWEESALCRVCPVD